MCVIGYSFYLLKHWYPKHGTISAITMLFWFIVNQFRGDPKGYDFRFPLQLFQNAKIGRFPYSTIKDPTRHLLFIFSFFCFYLKKWLFFLNLYYCLYQLVYIVDYGEIRICDYKAWNKNQQNTNKIIDKFPQNLKICKFSILLIMNTCSFIHCVNDTDNIEQEI